MKKKFIILVFNKGEAERFICFKFSKRKERAIERARYIAQAFICDKVIVFRCNKYGIAEEKIAEFFFGQVTPRLDPEKPIVIKEIEKKP